MPRPEPVTFIGYLHDILGVPAEAVDQTVAVFQKSNRRLLAMQVDIKPGKISQRAFLTALLAGEVEELSGVVVSLSVEDLVNNPKLTLRKLLGKNFGDIFTEYSDFAENRRGQQASILIRDQITVEDANKVMTPDSILMRIVNRTVGTGNSVQYQGFPLSPGTSGSNPVESKMTLVKWSDDDGAYIDRYYLENGLDSRLDRDKPYEDMANSFKGLAGQTRTAAGRLKYEAVVNESLVKAWGMETFGAKQFTDAFEDKPQPMSPGSSAPRISKGFWGALEASGRDLNKTLKNDQLMAKVFVDSGMLPDTATYMSLTGPEKAMLVNVFRNQYLATYNTIISSPKHDTPEDVAIALTEQGLPLDLSFGAEPLIGSNPYYTEPYTYNKKYFKMRRGSTPRDVSVEKVTRTSKEGTSYKAKVVPGIDSDRSFAVPDLLPADLQTVRINHSRNVANDIIYDPGYEVFRREIQKRRFTQEYTSNTDQASVLRDLTAQKNELSRELGGQVSSFRNEYVRDITTRASAIMGSTSTSASISEQLSLLLEESPGAITVLTDTQLGLVATYRANKVSLTGRDAYVNQKIRESDQRLDAAKRVTSMTQDLSLTATFREFYQAVADGSVTKQGIVATRLFGIGTGAQAAIQYRSISDPVGLITIQNALTRLPGISAKNAEDIVSNKAVQSIYNFYDDPDKALMAFLISRELDPKRFATMKQLPAYLKPFSKVLESRVPIMLNGSTNAGFLGSTLSPYKTYLLNGKETQGIFTPTYGVFNMAERVAKISKGDVFLLDALNISPADMFRNLESPDNFLRKFGGFLKSIRDDPSLLDNASLLDSDFLFIAEKLKVLGRSGGGYEILSTVSKGKDVINLEKYIAEIDTFFDGGAADLLIKMRANGVPAADTYKWLKKLSQRGLAKDLNQLYASPLQTYQRFVNWVNEFYLKNLVFNDSLVKIPILGRVVRLGQNSLRSLGVSEELGLIAAIKQYSIWDEAKQARALLRNRALISQMRNQAFRDNFFSQIEGNRYLSRFYSRFFDTNGRFVGSKGLFRMLSFTKLSYVRFISLLQPMFLAAGVATVFFLSRAGFSLFINIAQLKFGKGFREAMDELRMLFKVILYVFIYPILAFCSCCLFLVLLIIVTIITSINPLLLNATTWVSERVSPSFFRSILDLLGIIN